MKDLAASHRQEGFLHGPARALSLELQAIGEKVLEVARHLEVPAAERDPVSRALRDLALPECLVVSGAPRLLGSFLPAFFEANLWDHSTSPSGSEPLWHCANQSATRSLHPRDLQVSPLLHPLLEELELVLLPPEAGVTYPRLQGNFPSRRPPWLFLHLIDAQDPWSAPQWELLESTPERTDRRPLCRLVALANTAALDPRDLTVLHEHLTKLIAKKCGQILPIFSLPHLQCQFQPTPQDRNPESDWKSLRTHVQQALLTSPARLEQLDDLWRQLNALRRRSEEQIEGRAWEFEEHLRSLRLIEDDLQSHRDRLTHPSDARPPKRWGELFAQQGRAVRQELAQSLEPLQLLRDQFDQEDSAARLGKNLEEHISRAFQQEVAEDGQLLMEECQEHWESVSPELHRKLGFEPPSFEVVRQNLQTAALALQREMGKGSLLALSQLPLHTLLHSLLKERRKTLMGRLQLALLLLTTSGVLGALGLPLPASLLLLGNALLLLHGWWQSRQKRHETLRFYLERIDDLRHPFSKLLIKYYAQGIGHFFVSYSDLFGGIRRQLAQDQEALQPQLETLHHLDTELRDLLRALRTL